MMIRNLIVAAASFTLTMNAAAALRVVATIPDVADLVRRIGGEHVHVDTLARGTEDIHAVPQRPSFVTLLNRADAVAHIGLGMEHAFLPAVLEAAANPSLNPGEKGDIDCSKYVAALDIPKTTSRAEGELHPEGNPHYNVDPRNGELMARAIAEKLAVLDPVHASAFHRNKENFVKEWKKKLAEWEGVAAKTRGIKIVSQHRDMVYLADFLGMEIIGEVEPKPGIAPSPRYLESLVKRMKEAGVKVIIHEIQYSDKIARWLKAQTGANIAKVGTMGGAFPDAATYLDMIDRNLTNILGAAQ